MLEMKIHNKMWQLKVRLIDNTREYSKNHESITKSISTSTTHKQFAETQYITHRQTKRKYNILNKMNFKINIKQN